MTTPTRITEEARKLIDEGNCADCINDMHCDCFERYCDALTAIDTAAEQRGREMERAACLKIADEATLECEWTDGVVEASKIAAAIRSRTTEG